MGMQTTAPYEGPPVDIWSTGVILYIMVGGAFPFVEATMKCDLYASMAAGNFARPDHFSKDLIDLLKGMFIIDPRERFKIDQVKQSRWLNPDKDDGMREPDDHLKSAGVPEIGAEASMAIDDMPMAMPMDEEPVYRTLDPSMLSVESAGIEEEPMYRAVDLDMFGGMPSESLTPTQFSVSEAATPTSCIYSCRPTGLFSTQLSAHDLMQTLTTELQARDATVTAKPEKGQLKVQMVGKTGDMVKIKILVSEQNGTTQCAVKRMKGHALNYCDLFSSFKPIFARNCTKVTNDR